MKMVSFCSLKGGTGKTTLSYNLAERAHSAGFRVAICDFDPQECCVSLRELREQENGSRSGWDVYTGRVGVSSAEGLVKIREQGNCDLLICDLPGADSMALVRFLQEMDLVLSPVGVSIPELVVAGNLVSMLGKMNLPLVFVGNDVPPGRFRREEMVRELEGLGVEVCPVMVERRVAFLDSLRGGLGVCESVPGSAAAVQVDDLWRWLVARLNLNIEGGVGDDYESGIAVAVES